MTDHVEDAALAAYDQYAPSVSEKIADRCALAFREGFLAGHAEAESESRAANERLQRALDLEVEMGVQRFKTIERLRMALQRILIAAEGTHGARKLYEDIAREALTHIM